MWCGKCQADVAAEVSSDNQRVFCTVCGGLLSTVDVPPSSPPPASSASGRVKDAHELLKRWSNATTTDPFAPLPPTTPVAPPPTITQSILGHGEFAVRPGDSVSLTQLSPSQSPLAIQSPSNLGSPIGTSFSVPNQSGGIPTSPVVSANSLSNLLTNSLRSEFTASPLATPTAGNPILAPPSPLATNAESNIESSQWSVLESVDQQIAASDPIAPRENLLASQIADAMTSPSTDVAESEPSDSSNATTRRIDAAHPQSRYSERTLPMPPANLSTGPFVERPKAKPQPAPEPSRPLNWLPKWDTALWRRENASASNWSVTAGQLLAYCGVLGLTLGGCMIIWSFFGGPANYAQTGWLIATAGQMMLFFGIVTLVSGGLEQTTEQVNRRIEQLGDHIIRIEQAARENGLNGSVPAAHIGMNHDVNLVSAESRDERSVIED